MKIEISEENLPDPPSGVSQGPPVKVGMDSEGERPVCRLEE